jgi:hypothetical protein
LSLLLIARKAVLEPRSLSACEMRAPYRPLRCSLYMANEGLRVAFAKTPLPWRVRLVTAIRRFRLSIPGKSEQTGLYRLGVLVTNKSVVILVSR